MSSKSEPLRFTNPKLKAVCPPDKGRLYLRDSLVPGLILDVTSKGAKTFRLYKKVNGRPRRIFIAAFTGDNLTEARNEAKILSGKLAAGADLEGDVVSRGGGAALGVYFDRWIERYAKPHRPGTWRHDQQLFDGHIRPVLGNRPLRAIQQRHIRALHAQIAEKARARVAAPGPAPKRKDSAGQRTANRMLQLLSILFNCAREWSDYNGDNPTSGVRRFKEGRRERYLLQDEAPRFFEALAAPETPLDTRDFILLGLFTGARRGNLMAMRWADVSTEARLWTIPAETTKTDRPYYVPLVPPAVALIEERKKTAVNGMPWVFPAASASGHMVSFQKQWAAFLARAGLSDLRFHDLRHTLASWQAIAGTSLAIIGRGLGHNSPTTTNRYAHINVDPVRASMEQAAGALLRAADTTREINR